MSCIAKNMIKLKKQVQFLFSYGAVGYATYNALWNSPIVYKHLRIKKYIQKNIKAFPMTIRIYKAKKISPHMVQKSHAKFRHLKWEIQNWKSNIQYNKSKIEKTGSPCKTQEDNRILSGLD